MDQAVRNALAEDPRVGYALIFGSEATGRRTPFSDLDIAIGLTPGARLDRGSLGEMIANLERATGRTVDLVVLDEASPALAYRTFRDGRLVFEPDRASRVRCETQAILEYLDFQPVEALCARAVLDAAAHG